MNARACRCVGLCLLVWAAAVAAAGATPATTQPVGAQPTSRPAAGGATGDLKANLRRLRSESLTPPATTTSAQLQRMIEELKSIRVSPRRRGKGPLAVLSVPGTGSRRAAGQPAGEGDPNASAATTRPASPRRTLPKEMLDQLKGLPVASLSRPVEFANELYQNGYLGAALMLYERALSETADPNQRSWALYQMANCRRETDPADAEKLYQRLLTEHPKTLWARTGAVERELLLWRRVNRPMEMLKAIEPIGRPRPLATTQPATTQPATTQPATTQPATTQPATTQPAESK